MIASIAVLLLVGWAVLGIGWAGAEDRGAQRNGTDRLCFRLYIMDDLRERLLKLLPLSEEERLEHSRLSYEDRTTDLRVERRVERRRRGGLLPFQTSGRRHAHGLVVAGAHAGLMRIILSRFDVRADLAFGRAMTTPAVYQMTHDGMAWSVDLRPLPFGEADD